MGNMPASTFRVEIGAWVESSTPKASGKGMRKVWIAPAPKGESPRLSVIRAGERGDVHVLTLHVGDEAQQGDALEALSLALDALGALPAFAVPAPTPKPARKAPTPPVAPNAAVAANRAIALAAALSVASNAAVAANRAIALAAAPKAQTRQPAPAKTAPKLDWFAELMHAEGAV